MCNIICLKLMLVASEGGEVVKVVDVLEGCMHCIYKVVDAMSIDLCGISGDIQY